MQIDFKIEMAKRTDEELIRILTVDKVNYLPAALAAANEEFNKRDLQTEKVNLITADVSQKKEQENVRANESLFVGVKILSFLIPLVFTLILSGYYKADGYDRKARELGTWTLYGFCFYFVLTIVLIAM
jgi:hypothetical protein